MNFRELLAQFLQTNSPDPKMGGGFVPNLGMPPAEEPQIPSMKPVSSHRPSPSISPMLSHGRPDLSSMISGSGLPSYPQEPKGPLATPIAPLSAPTVSMVKGSGLPAPAPTPAPPMSTPGSPLMGATPLDGIQGGSALPEPEQEPLTATRMDNAADGLPGQGPQMRLSQPVEPLAKNGDLVSLIQRLLHKR